MTLTGTITLNDGSVPYVGWLRFFPLTYPVPTSPIIYSGAVYDVETEDDGTFTVELFPAAYRVEWRVRSIVNRAFFVLESDDTNLADVIASTPDGAALVPVTSEFDTVAEMLASDTRFWRVGVCANYSGADGIYSEWRKTASTTLLPNGTDVLSSDDGLAILIRTYVRENLDGGVSLPNPSGAPYRVAFPIVYETISEMQLGWESAMMVTVIRDANGNRADFTLGGTGTDDGQNEIVNAAGVHYVRLI